MRTFWLAAASLFVFTLSASLLAQPIADESKEREARISTILDETIGGIHELKLPENRAYADAQAGVALWDHDRERATELFASAGVELAAAIDALAHTHHRSDRYYDANASNLFRQQILTTIAQKDASLALDILRKTRPAAVMKAMAADPRDKRISSNQNNEIYVRQNEATLEDTLYRMAADQDPVRSIALLKEALSGPFSTGTFEALTRLAAKDPSIATEQASTIVQRLTGTPIVRSGQPDYVTLSLANQIIDYAIQNSPEAKLHFDAGDVRELALRMITSYISDPQARNYINATTVERYAEKLAPNYTDAIKRITSTTPVNTDPVGEAYNKFVQSDPRPEQMVATAAKFPENFRRDLYQSAANKLMNQGDIAAARSILEENFTDEARAAALTDFDRNSVYRLMSASKFQEAETVINGMPEDSRPLMLIQLATRAYASDKTGNKAYAVALLDNAHSIIGDHPSDQNEMAELMAIVGAFATIEPSRGLDIFERLVPQINELADAAATMYSFQGNNNVRDGEFITANNGFTQFGFNGYMLGQLATSDLDRTLKLVDSFARPEIRMTLKLQMVSSGQNTLHALPISGRRGFVVLN